ncbi:MAG: radical SAM protein [Myxococcota bacterium]
MSPQRTLLIHPPMSIARDFIDYPYMANLGARQLAAVLESHGPATLVDAFALAGAGLEWQSDGRARLGASVDRVLAAAEGTYDAIVCTYTPFHRPPFRDDVLGKLLVALRDAYPGIPILLTDAYQSGQHYVEAPGEEVLRSYPEVTGYLKYEAEATLPTLLREGTLEGIFRGASPDLSTLPFPTWDETSLQHFDAFRAAVVSGLGRGAWSFPIDGRTIPLVTSRGCPFRCTHCSSNPGLEPGEPKRQRRYPNDRLDEYLETLVGEHRATRLFVLDELINVNAGHFDRFLAKVAELGVKFEVPNGMRADYLEPRHFARMRGRVTTVSVSAESGSKRVLDEVVQKQLELRHIQAAAENAHRAGVSLLIHFMIGLPGETAREVNETLDLALDLWDRYRAFPAVQFATPLPGTGLAAGRTLPVVEDWGPYFQKAPSQPGATVSEDELRRFRATFEQRLQASMGPEKLIMNVTYVCNNHCTFCAVGTRTQVDGHPPRQRDHLLKYRRHGVTMVDFDGGEPTLNPELVPLIRYARKLGYERINVTTNGRLCAYPDYAKKLVTSGLTTLLFSVHGPNARIHAQQVGVKEAFEQTTTGIRNCVAAAPPEVELGMNITVTKGNYRLLDEVAELALSLGLPWLNIQFLTPFGRATKWVAPDTGEAARIAMRTIDRYRDRMKFQVINLPFCFMPGYEEFVTGDLGKLSRHMVFVNNETVNLADYLAERRVRKEVCESCPHRCFCGGFYELEDVPEPEWVVSEEALLARVRPELLG